MPFLLACSNLVSIAATEMSTPKVPKPFLRAIDILEISIIPSSTSLNSSSIIPLCKSKLVLNSELL